MRQSRWLGSICLCALVALTATHARAAIPGASDPEVYTYKSFVATAHEYNRLTLVDEYQARGKKNPAWDAAALEFLEAMAVRFSNANQHWRYRVPGQKTPDELMAMGAALEALGCDDALVQYCHIVVLHDSQAIPDIRPRLGPAVDGLIAQGYPSTRIASAAKRLRDEYDREDQAAEYQKYDGLFREHLIQSLCAPAFDAKYARIYWQHFGDEVNRYNLDEQKTLLDQLKQRGADAWFVDVASGVYHVGEAWDARGGGWAKDVTPQGWEGFHRHLDIARGHFVSAWKAAPDRPEPAAEMIRIAHADGAYLKEHYRVWFDRAVKAQFDYDKAYNLMYWGLKPRWGGSYRQMYAFGLECLNTNRFDTGVPFQFARALETMTDDAEGDYSYWRERGAYEALKRLVDGEVAQTSDPDWQNWIKSYHAAAAWRCGRYAEACAALEDVGDGLKPDVFERLDALSGRVVLESYAYSSPSASKIKLLEAQVARGGIKPALDSYRKTADTITPDDPAGPFVQARVRELEMQEALAGGDWVSVQPVGDLNTWVRLRGSWMIAEDGALVGTADENGLRLILHQSPGTNYEISGVVDLRGVDAESESLVGPFVAYGTETLSYQLVIEKKRGRVALRSGANRFKSGGKPPFGDEVAFVVRMTGDKMSVWLDGNEIIHEHAMRHRMPNKDYRIGVGGHLCPAGTVVRFKDLKVRRL